jgi:putative hydrolase of HD superfamily
MNEYYSKTLFSIKNTERYSSRLPCLREKLAGHCFSMIELAEGLAFKYNLNIDIDLAKNIAQNHDLGEYLKGDIDAGKIVHGKISENEKESQELEAWEEIGKMLPKNLYEQKRAYWDSFEKGDSLEAKYAKVIDKLEALLHMAEVGAGGFKKKTWFRKNGFDEKDYVLTATYADKIFKEFLAEAQKIDNPGDLEGFLGELKSVKEKFKEIYKQIGVPWKEEYNYAMK